MSKLTVFAAALAVVLAAALPGVAAPSARALVRRAAPFRPNLGSLAQPALRRGGKVKADRVLHLDLFDDTPLVIDLHDAERDLAGTLTWTGRVNGSSSSEATISIAGDAVTATFIVDGKQYAIHPSESGLEAQELDPSAFPDEAPPDLITTAITAPLITSPDAGSTIDILVAYTHVVRQNLGSTDAALTLIGNSVARMNLALQNSLVSTRVRLVGTTEVQYDDTIAGFQTTLIRLRDGSDGSMDSIQTLRNQLGADAVSLIVWRPADSACGLGYLMSNPSATFENAAYNVVRQDCANGNLSLAHEFGHNFGLEHDRANASPSASYPWAYGYYDPARLFRDVMAYPCGGACPRIAYFSNPDVLYNGRPTGVNYLASNAADNARALNANARIASQWRQSVTPAVTFTDDPLVAGVTPVRAIHLTELRDAINIARARVGLPAATFANDEVVKASHITELRNALTPVLNTRSITPAFIELAPLTVIRAVHIQELRDLLR